jgi:PAS domain S-box-containing protein
VGDLAILRDVTERKRAEEIIRASEEKYRDLFENTNDLIQSVTPEGRFKYVNSAWRKTLGYSEEEVSDLTIFSIVHPDYLEHYQLLFQKIMSGKDVGQVDTVFVTKNGEKVVVDGNINCRFMGGKPMYTRAIFRDITERKHVEEEVIRLANAIRMSSDSIIISDLESKITDVNQATLEMYGAESKEDLIGKNFLELVVSEWRGTVLEDIREVQDSGYVKGQEYHIISKDSREVPVEMSSALVKDAEGKLIGFIRVGRDLSERKRVEELYRTLADSSPVGVYIVQNGKFQLVNPRFQKDTGYTENELLGVDSLDIVLPEDRNVVRENAIRMLKGERSEPYEYRSIMRGGDVRWAIETVTSIYYKGERATLGNYIDITERKQAEEREGQLQQSPV